MTGPVVDEDSLVPISFSKLNTFETCPRQYEAKYVTKTVPYQQTPEAEWGDYVHKSLENYIRYNQPLPANVADYQRFADAILAMRGQAIAERAVAINPYLMETGYFDGDVWIRAKIDVTVLRDDSALVLDWKGLALDTPLPTPTGWTTMGDVQEGDAVLGGDGRPCQIVGKSQIHQRPCFRLRFDDGSEVVCDDEHLWSTDKGVVSAREIYNYNRKNNRYKTPVVAPLNLLEEQLPIHPYVLGLWLADGKHTSGEITKPDGAVWDRVAECGYSVNEDYSRNSEKCRAHTILGLRKQLRETGLLGNKHIPGEYLRASHTQRLSLLQGLMDGDGSVNPQRKQCVFTNCDKGLSDAVVDLLLTLGQRPHQDVTTQRGFGLEVTAYPVVFRPLHGLNPFSLPRKADCVGDWGPGHSHRRVITSVEPVVTVPTQCISVDSSDCTYLCTDRMITTHNTGKMKDDPKQLMFYALLAFIMYPQVQKVQTGFIWLKDRVVSEPKTFTRDQYDQLLAMWRGKYDKLKEAHDLGVFPPKPNGLCNGWCEVTSCEHWKPKKGKR